MEMGYLTVLQLRLGAKIGDLHAKDFNTFANDKFSLRGSESTEINGGVKADPPLKP